MVAAVAIGATVASTAVGAYTSSKAASAQAKGAQAAGDAAAAAQFASIDEQRRQYDTTRSDFAPYREVGRSALFELSALFMPGSQKSLLESERQQLAAQNDALGESLVGVKLADQGSIKAEMAAIGARYGDVSRQLGEMGDGDSSASASNRFRETPGYQFAFDEGINALDRSAAARGGLRGGGYARELTRYGQGMADQQFNNYANRLSSLAGVGQAATGSTAAAGQQSAAGISNSLMAGAQMQGNALQNAATARASGYAGIGNAVSSGMNNLAFIGMGGMQ